MIQLNSSVVFENDSDSDNDNKHSSISRKDNSRVSINFSPSDKKLTRIKRDTLRLKPRDLNENSNVMYDQYMKSKEKKGSLKTKSQ